MWKVIAIVVLLIAIYLGCFSKEPEPPIVQDDWWGKGAQQTEDHGNESDVLPFEVFAPSFALRDLRRRLELTRLGEDLEDGNHHYGMQVSTIQKFFDHWKEKYEWREQEKILNSFPQFTTKIEGLNVHFWHVKPEHSVRRARPLIMVHGWPGSVWEFYKIVPLLTADDFELIVPSIPGYGWSEAPHKQGFDASDAARIFHKLMLRLRFKKYYAHGGDWGGQISTIMGQLYPDSVIGLHVNFPVSASTTIRSVFLTIKEHLFPVVTPTPLQRLLYYASIEGGYFHIQATKPDTVGIALNDSPVGLAAYILEKFSYWTNPEYKDLPDAGLTEKFTIDELLTNVMIYWLSGSVQSSMRFYKEFVYSEIIRELMDVPVKVPAGIAMAPNEIIYSTEPMARLKYKNLVHYTALPQGGHFLAFEEPELLAQDLVKFVKLLESENV